MFENCTVCHREGESAPFVLLSYEDVKNRAAQIVDVTQRRYMPPWLPSESHAEFEDERRLTTKQLGTLQRWVDAGTPEGDPSDLPPMPTWKDGWHLGRPDLVVTMPRSYQLPADGTDVYRNFVIPVELNEAKWIKAVEFRPDNKSIVHHAFILTDRSKSAVRFEQEDDQPGFEGMDSRGALSPAAQFLSWQPGRLPAVGSEQFAWQLVPGTDLVLQLHMQPTGKSESIQASVGLYFTDQPPPYYPYKLCLRSTEIDIPAGEANYQFTKEYRLPVDVELHAVLPHAHYLGKRLEGYATLPNGTRKPLILIEDWDFNWQSDYRFKTPLRLPRGTVITQRFTYDNSTDNVRNPNHPPQRVKYGLQSTDEMGELWLQVLVRDKNDFEILNRDNGRRAIIELISRRRGTLLEDPKDVRARVDLAQALMAVGQMNEAIQQLKLAIEHDVSFPDAHYYLGHAFLRLRQNEAAQKRLQATIQLDPDHFLAQHDLGLLYLKAGAYQQAVARFREAVRIDPYHAVAQSNLGLALYRVEDFAEAAVHFERSLELRPTHGKTQEYLRRAKAMARD